MRLKMIYLVVFGLISLSFQNKERYQIVNSISAKFENEHYIDSLEIFSEEIAILFEKFSEAVEKVIPQKELGYDLWIQKDKGSFGITLDSQNWEENLRCNVHFQDRIGFEAVSPNIIIRDTKLGIDYCFFEHSSEYIKREDFFEILKLTFSIEMKL